MGAVASVIRLVAIIRASLENSKAFILGLVMAVNLLDQCLVTAIAPIIPHYLYERDIHTARKAANSMLHNVSQTSSKTAAVSPARDDGMPMVDDIRKLLDISEENDKVGFLLASRSVVQIVTNPFVGYFVNKHGCVVVLLVGVVTMFTSAIVYSLADSFWAFLAGRSIHGLGSSCTAIAGFALLAYIYPDEKSRSKAMGLTLGGQAMGVLIGFPFGSVLYQFCGRQMPFAVISVALFMEIVLMSLLIRSEHQGKVDWGERQALTSLLCDRYILAATVGVFLQEAGISLLESTIPIWVEKTMRAEKWQLGAVFLPDSVAFLLSSNLVGSYSSIGEDWLKSMLSFALSGVCFAVIPSARTVYHLLLPHFGIGLALGIVDASLFPLLGNLVDMRHPGSYGSVYSLCNTSVAAAFIVSPIIGGLLVKHASFSYAAIGMGALHLLFAPLNLLLRDAQGAAQASASRDLQSIRLVNSASSASVYSGRIKTTMNSDAPSPQAQLAE